MAGPGDARELDIEQPGELEAYLRSTGRVPRDEPLAVRRLTGGVSNRTMVVERGNGQKWVVKQGLAKLRVAVDWFSEPIRVHREALAMQWLNRTLPAGTVPALVFEDERHYLLAMDFVPAPHESWKTLLLNGAIEPDHFRQFGELLGMIHGQGSRQRASLPAELADCSLFESLRLEPYYGFTADQVPQAADFLRQLAHATRARHDTFVHGDYSPKNVLVRAGRLILLDHEVAHIGDPGFDLGFAMAHLVSKAHFRVDRRAELARGAAEFWAIYRQSLGAAPWDADLEERAVRHTLGCLLARVAGRSPLEYFQDTHRARQRQAVLKLMANPPRSVAELIPEFLQKVDLR